MANVFALKIRKPLEAGLSAALLAISVLGCADVNSSHVSQGDIYHNYSADYSEVASAVTLSASFKVGKGVGGTYVRLDNKSEVRANGTAMKLQKSSINQVVYQHKIEKVTPDQLEQPFEINYVDNTGKTYVNKAVIPKPFNLVVPNLINRRGGFKMAWSSSDNLQSSDSIEIEFLAPPNDTCRVVRNLTGTKGVLQLDAREANCLWVGAVQVQSCRHSVNTKVQAAEIGGMLSQSYCGSPVSSTVSN